MSIITIRSPKERTHSLFCNFSHLVDWNEDPSGQCLEQVGTNNIVRNEDDPTVNRVDLAPTIPLSLSFFWCTSFSKTSV